MPFCDLPSRLADVREKIDLAAARGGHAQRVTIIAVTKTHGPEAVHAAVQAGIWDVGENRIQEATSKMCEVAVPVRWHLIGHLQRNKVKSLDGFSLVHSIDSARLADAVSGFGVERGQRVDALVQVNVVGEESKGGFSPSELQAEAERFHGRGGITVRGVMAMAPLDADESVLRRVFAGARAARDLLCGAGLPAQELSMGMSNDFEIAIEEGATMVRLGTILFGAREAGK